MNPEVGDIVEVVVSKVSGYACWGSSNGKIGFSHCIEWSEEKPVPAHLIPIVGESIKLRVFHVPKPEVEQPDDVSFGGTIHVDFAGSRRLVDDDAWKANRQKQKNSFRFEVRQ